MAVVTGAVVATTATNATASASAASGGATISTATAAKQADSIRRLAAAFIKSAEMKVVGESEIVDEFASPIYAGLAAVPTGPTPPTPGTPKAKPSGPLEDLVGMKGEPTVDPKKLPSTIEHPGQQAQLPGGVEKGPSLPVEKPEVKELIDRYYDAPTISDQLAAGNDKIVIDRNVLDEKVVVNGDNRTAMCIIEERVVDRKYLEHGNLTDLMSEVRHGHIPTIRQLYLAIIDLTDLATFRVFRPLLARVKLEPATYRLRQLTADFERKSLKPTLEREETTQTKLDRKIEERSWFKTDHVVEKVGHKDVESKKEIEIAVTNITDLCTVELSKGSIEGFMARRSELMESFADANSIARIENTLTPEAIAGVNKTALAWVREDLCSTTSEYSTVETFNRYKVDLDGFLGKKIEMSDKQVTERVKTSLTEYLSPSDKISLENIDTYQQALEKFVALQKTMTQEFDPTVVDSYVVPGEGVTFDDGWITYIPAGSIVNLGIKTDLDAKITGWDVFWAAVDVATIAVAVATWGTSTAVTSAGMAVGKAAVKGGVKAVAKSGAKAAAKASAKAAAKTSAKAAAKQTGRVAINNAGRVGTKIVKTAGAKANVAKTTADATAKSATNKAAKGAVKAETAATGKTVAGKEAQAGVGNSVKQSGKIKINNSGTAGTKAKPSVDVSKPDVTYKNIPRTGKYDGVPGDSLYHPDPKARPSNPKANPKGKTNAEILRENNMEEGIPFEKGYPDFSKASQATVNIENMGVNRSANMGRADSLLAQQVREGKAGSAIEKNLQKMGVDPKKATKGDISRMRKEYGLTWHEHQNKQTMQLIRKELHGTIPHKGGISALKQDAKVAANTTTSTTSDAAKPTAQAATGATTTAADSSGSATAGSTTSSTTKS